MTLPLAVLAARLTAALSRPLPGAAAHAVLRPDPAVTREPAPSVRPAAALVLLYEGSTGVTLLLTERSRSLPHHAGQISFPGGLVEPGEDLWAAACREAHEEAGIDPAALTRLGALSPLHIPVSGFLLHPFVGVARGQPRFAPHPPEVSRLVEASWEALQEPRALRAERRHLSGRERTVPYFDVGGDVVWGATAMILAELLWIAEAPSVRSGGRERPGP